MWKVWNYAAVLVCALAVTAAAEGGGQGLSGQGIMEPAEKGVPEQGIAEPAEKGAATGQAALGQAQTLTGCLQKGEEANTFTLANASKKGGSKLGDVELVDAPSGLNLKEHIWPQGRGAGEATRPARSGEDGAGRRKECGRQLDGARQGGAAFSGEVGASPGVFLLLRTSKGGRR